MQQLLTFNIVRKLISMFSEKLDKQLNPYIGAFFVSASLPSLSDSFGFLQLRKIEQKTDQKKTLYSTIAGILLTAPHYFIWKYTPYLEWEKG